MKKIFLTEADRKKIISDREKVIVESFAKTFNSIKRIDENEINPTKKLTPQEEQILADILSGGDELTEDFSRILDKVKEYVSKGLMTSAIVASLLATPGMSAAEQSAIKQTAGIENVDQKSDNSDITKMNNTELYNLVLKIVKSNPNRASALLLQMHGTNKEDATDLNMLQTFVDSVKSGNPIGTAEYMGGRFKMASKYTQQLIKIMQSNVQKGGFGFNENDVNEVLTKQVTTGTGWDTKTKTVQQGNLELNSYSKQLYQLFKKEGANPALLSGKGVANAQETKKNNVVITAWDDELTILIQNVNDPMAMANKYGPMIEKQFPKFKLTKKPTTAGWGGGVEFTFTLENGGVQQQKQPVNNQQ